MLTKARPCKWCGELFYPRNANGSYCSDKCRQHAIAAQRQEFLELKKKGIHKMTLSTCVVCGKNFRPKNKQQQCCCKACAMVYVARGRGYNVDHVNVASEEGTPHGLYDLEFSRFCHDCGKPTNDYRCPSCLKKWRNKYGVEVEDFPEENDEY